MSTVGTRIKVIPSFGNGTLPTSFFKVGGPQGYPSDLSPGRSNEICFQNGIYDIGTEILLLTKNDHNWTQKAPKSIIPEEIKSVGHSPSSGSVKTRFKSIFKK